MDIYQHLILTFCVTWWIFAIICIIRNFFVFYKRNKMIVVLNKLCDEDAKNFKCYNWRIKEFNSLNYNKMVVLFWKPLKEFYNDMKCLKGEVNEETKP